MAKEKDVVYLVYEDDCSAIILGALLTNRSITIEEAIFLLDIDMDEFAKEQGWDDWNPECLALYL